MGEVVFLQIVTSFGRTLWGSNLVSSFSGSRITMTQGLTRSSSKSTPVRGADGPLGNNPYNRQLPNVHLRTVLGGSKFLGIILSGPVQLGGSGEYYRLPIRSAFPSARVVQLRTCTIPSHDSNLVRPRVRLWDRQWGDR